MQQLTLQFDGYADSRPSIDVGATKQRKEAVCREAFQHFLDGQGKSATRPSCRKSVATGFQAPSLMSWLRQESPLFSSFAGESITRLEAIFGTVAVVSGFLLISFTALIGG